MFVYWLPADLSWLLAVETPVHTSKCGVDRAVILTCYTHILSNSSIIKIFNRRPTSPASAPYLCPCCLVTGNGAGIYIYIYIFNTWLVSLSV